ncbi:MAG: hypothetical protein WKG03_09690 [Telluria sp.]
MSKPIISGPYRTFRRLNKYETYLEYEGSVITIPMKGRSVGGEWLYDEIKLHAFMRLEIYPPYINNLGTREFQFTIRDWDLYGTSPMLNQLFFKDPRGRRTTWLDKKTNEYREDYVPATVTFRVANNFSVESFDKGVTPCDVFAPIHKLEIRNLTSHHFRSWVEFPESEEPWSYTHPEHRIYWSVLSAAEASRLSERSVVDTEDKKSVKIAPMYQSGVPIIIFHKKDPREGDFDLANQKDRMDDLLAIASLGRPKVPGTTIFEANLPIRGSAGNYTQINGNTVLSTSSRAREGLEIHWSLAEKFDELDQLNEFIVSHAEKSTLGLSGVIRLVSPARSLGTADQGPEFGDKPDSADFPARITYAVNYDIFLNSDQFVEDHAGIAIAVGALEIPPRDVTVAFDKPHLGYVLSRFLEFGPGHCTGMHEIPPREYAAGLNQARYWRTVPLDDVGDWSDFQPYDPRHDY